MVSDKHGLVQGVGAAREDRQGNRILILIAVSGSKSPVNLGRMKMFHLSNLRYRAVRWVQVNQRPPAEPVA